MKQLQALFSLATDMLCVTDMDGRFLLANPAFTKALGWSADELSATSLQDLVHPDDRESTALELRRLGSGEPSIRFENRCRQRDGGYKVLTWTAEADLRAGVVHAVARDVTAARQSLDRLMDDLPGMLYRCRPDDDWTMVYVSAGSKDLTGYTPDALLAPGDPTPASITFPEDRERVRQEVQAAVAENREYEIEYRLRTADGTEKLVWERGRAITGENGAPLLQGFVADITERRMLRSELQQLQKMDALGQLTGGIAHDFNNLLTVVIGNLELMESIAGDNPEMTAHLGEAMEAAWRGVDLSQRLLAFSRKQMLAPEVISVNALIGDMEVLLRRTLGAGIDIEVSRADELPLVRVDPGQLENAILNLAINARDAMPNGGTMRIRTGQFKADRRYADARPDVEPGRYVMIEVADTGIGMTPEIRERAFEPFFTTKERGKGTGLGLSMVYGLLKQSGGHARVYSEPGHGTSVKLYLPETDPDAADPPTNTVRLLREHGGKAERILVVEDDDAVRRLVVTSLKELGYRTMEASSGPEGLEVLEQHGRDIDLLLTDLVMPGGLNGVALARQARDRFAHIRVLLTSGFSEEHASLQGEFPLLSKPYRKAELALAVRAALDAENATGN